jgi:transcriptional regulator with XRE-family HTH domain
MSLIDMPARPATALALYRHALGLRATDVAAVVGISSGHLSMVERGHRQPSRLLRKSLAMALGVDETELFPEGAPIP